MRFSIAKKSDFQISRQRSDLVTNNKSLSSDTFILKKKTKKIERKSNEFVGGRNIIYYYYYCLILFIFIYFYKLLFYSFCKKIFFAIFWGFKLKIGPNFGFLSSEWVEISISGYSGQNFQFFHKKIVTNLVFMSKCLFKG